MTERLRLTGIKAEGRHGATEGEQDSPQPFVVDVDAIVDVRRDDLGGTADYRAIVGTVQRLVTDQSFQLLETLARQIASIVISLPGVRSCRVIVHKPRAADSLGIADVTAEATAEGE